jgi:CRP-like cAMP-binding protein
MNIHTMWRDGRGTMQNGAPSLRTNEQASLREVALAELQMSSLPQKHVAAGTMIMHPDAATDALYFIIAGRIRLYRLAPGGEEVFQGELGPGDCLKCPRILCRHECHTFAEAIVESTLDVLSKPLFDRLTRDSVVFNQRLFQDVASEMGHLDQRFYEASVMPMKVRLHAELLCISKRRSDGLLLISPPPTHQDLANRIGSQREAVSKELIRLERGSVIRRSRASIHLVREDVLRQEVADWNDDPKRGADRALSASNAAHREYREHPIGLRRGESLV